MTKCVCVCVWVGGCVTVCRSVGRLVGRSVRPSACMRAHVYVRSGFRVDATRRDEIRLSVDNSLSRFSPQVDTTLVEIAFAPVVDKYGVHMDSRYILIITVHKDDHMDQFCGLYFTDTTRTTAWQRAGASIRKMERALMARRIAIANESRRAKGMSALNSLPSQTREWR